MFSTLSLVHSLLSPAELLITVVTEIMQNSDDKDCDITDNKLDSVYEFVNFLSCYFW